MKVLLRVGQCTLQGTGQVDMEERPVQALDQRHFTAVPVRLAVRQSALQLVVMSTAAVGRGFNAVSFAIRCVRVVLETFFDVSSLLLRLVRLLVVHELGQRGGGGTALDFGNAEDRLPSVKSIFGGWGRVAETGGGQSSLGPAVVDVGEMPLHGLGSGVEIQLVAHIDQILHRGDIHIVDGREIKNDGAEGRQMRPVFFFLSMPRTRVVPWPIAKLAVGEGIRTTGLLEDCLDKVVGVVVAVGVVESLGESVDKDAGIRLLHFDLGVASIGVVDREEDGALEVALAIGRSISVARSILAITLHKMVTDDRVNSDPSQELAASFGNAEQQNGCGDGDSAVDTNLDGGEDGDKHTNKEDDRIQGRDAPKLVDGVWWGDEIAHRMDDDTREGCLGDVKEHSGQGVDGKQHDDCSNATGQGSSHSRLGLDGSPGKGSGGRVGTQERSQQVGNTNCNQLLRRVYGIVVDTAERLGDGNVLNQEDDDRSWEFPGKRFDDSGIDDRDGSMLEASGNSPQKFECRVLPAVNVHRGADHRVE